MYSRGEGHPRYRDTPWPLKCTELFNSAVSYMVARTTQSGRGPQDDGQELVRKSDHFLAVVGNCWPLMGGPCIDFDQKR